MGVYRGYLGRRTRLLGSLPPSNRAGEWLEPCRPTPRVYLPLWTSRRFRGGVLFPEGSRPNRKGVTFPLRGPGCQSAKVGVPAGAPK